jgi:hypothetical protein
VIEKIAPEQIQLYRYSVIRLEAPVGRSQESWIKKYFDHDAKMRCVVAGVIMM